MKDKIDKVSEKAREIEKKIDLHQTNKPIFNIDKNVLIHELLYCVNGWLESNIKSFQDSNILENIVDGTDQSLKWIHEYCNKENIREIEKSDDFVKQIYEMLNDAIIYQAICDQYILATNGILRDKISKNGKNIYFEEINKNRIKRKASNLLNFNELSQFMHVLQNNELKIAAKKMLDGHILLNKYLNKKDINLKWIVDEKAEIIENYIYYYRVYYESKSEFNSENKIWNNWQFNGIKLYEFKEFYYIMCSISTVFMKIKPKSIVKISIKEIEYIVSKISNIKIKNIKKLVDFYTYKYDANNKNISILSTPLVKAEEEHILIAPNLIFNSLVEKNILDLINRKKIYQNYYNELSRHKENYVIEELIEEISEYKNLNIIINKELPNKYGEIDILLLDKESKSIIALEVKSLLKSGSVKEDLNRTKDIEKGLNQCKKINNYLLENREEFIQEFFNIKNLQIENVYSCVVTQNEIINTIMDYSIKVITKNDLYKVFKEFNGDLSRIIQFIESEKYFPKKNVDYKVAKNELVYAGYTFRMDVVYDINDINASRHMSGKKNTKKKKKRISKR